MTRQSVLSLLLMLLLSHAAVAQLIPDDLIVEQVAAGYRFTEGPAAGPDGGIYFTDIPNKRIIRFDHATGQTDVYREDSGRANGLMFDPQGRLLACEGAAEGGNRRLSRTEPDGDIVTLADTWQGQPLNSPNDLDIDQLGGVYFTDPRYGNRDDMVLDVEAVYYRAPDGTLTRVIDGLVRPNGLILSPDEKTLYVADNAAKILVAYDIDTPGQPTNPRRFSDMGEGYGGGCDGMTVDAFGRVYATGDEGVYIFNPDGTPAGLVPTPERPANCTFANDGKTLYITARTSLYRAVLNTDVP
jgi:gluconolactonase